MTATFLGAPGGALAGLFPVAHIDEILGYVTSSWHDLVERWPSAHVFSLREEKLTASIYEHVNLPHRFSGSGLPPGKFHCEVKLFRRQQSGAVREVGRTDIQFELHVPGTPTLVIEFKKLNGAASLRRKYCLSGMKKFVDRVYADDGNIAVMFGLVAGSPVTEAAAMRTYISSTKMAAALACVGVPVTTQPSVIAPTSALFDTEHTRKKPDMPIRLAHCFLAFTSKAGTKKVRQPSH